MVSDVRVVKPKHSVTFIQIEDIFELADMDGDGEIEITEFTGTVPCTVQTSVYCKGTVQYTPS